MRVSKAVAAKLGVKATAFRRHKYGAKKTVVDNITFDSKKEAATYVKLLALEKAGKISELKLQVPVEVVINDMKICTWRADFVYVEGGKRIYLDVKGFRTREYVLKRKLVKAVLGIEILEL